MALLVLLTMANADLKVGETFPKTELPDQFDKTQRITKEDKWVLMTFEKSVAVELSKYFKQKPSNYLKDYKVKIISDISSMPTLITKMFALPKMRRYPFSVMLIRDEFGEQFDRKEGMVTLYRLRKGKIKEISFMRPEELDAALAAK